MQIKDAPWIGLCEEGYELSYNTYSQDDDYADTLADELWAQRFEEEENGYDLQLGG